MTDFRNDILANNILVRDSIKSENFVTGSTGWRIGRDGNAEFYNITARGNISATSLEVTDGTSTVRIPSGIPEVQWDPPGVEDPARVFGVSIGDFSTLEIRSPARLDSTDSRRYSLISMQSTDTDDDFSGDLELRVAKAAGDDEGWVRIVDAEQLFLVSDFGRIGFIQAESMRTLKERFDTEFEYGTFGNTNFNALSEGLSFRAPPSGIVKVSITSRIDQNGASSPQRLYIGYEIREGSTVGSGTLVSNAANTDEAVNLTHQGNSETHFETGTYIDTVEGLASRALYNIELHSRSTSSASVTQSVYRIVIIEPSM